MKDNFEIRYAESKDIPAIQEFINENWRKGHILARDENLLRWQYTSDKLDYVLGIDCTGRIQGMLGFISYDDTPWRDIATSMWKSNRGCGFLGIQLLMFVMQNERHRTVFCPGINMKSTKAIYEKMNFSIGKMNQWYRLRKKERYVIAKIENDIVPQNTSKNFSRLVEYRTGDELENDFDWDFYVREEMVPYKSWSYFKRRYLGHPFYKYRILGIKDNNEITKAVIVLRIQECQRERAIRFVDCIGDSREIGTITNEIDRILEMEDAEYIDMYETGVSKEMLIRAGWMKVEETTNIIPNYFSPYAQCNVPVYYCTTEKQIVLFRGDGDQDRPN